MKSGIAALILLLGAPAGVAAQWTVTVQAGVHFDRFEEPQRLLANGLTRMATAPGEAPVLGVRASYWLNENFGVDAGVAASQNQSWSGTVISPEPEFAKRTVFTSAALLWRPFGHGGRWSMHLGLGPAAITHDGSGTSLLSRQTDFGAVAAGGVELRIGDRLLAGLDVHNYRFSSRFTGSELTIPESRPGSRLRSEWLVLPTIRWVF